MNNKIVLSFTLFAIITSSCAQKLKIENINMNIRNEHITKDNVVTETLKKIKHYSEEPQYFIRPVQNNCIYEILVNDYPIYEENSLDILASPIEINKAILKTGSQTMTVRMYPIGDLLKDNYDMGETVTTLLDNSSMKVEIVKYEAYNISNRLDDERTVMTHYSPTMKGNKKFKGAGLPYYEYTFSFDAEVPYENEGWSNGEDLSKFDEIELKNKVVNFYENYKEKYKERDLEELIRLNYDMHLRKVVSYYSDKQFVKELWDEFTQPVFYNNREFHPIENYEVKFYGNNKIICLKFPKNESIDLRLRGESSFWFKFNNGDGLKARFSNIYLYIPKGGTLDDLQTIK